MKNFYPSFLTRVLAVFAILFGNCLWAQDTSDETSTNIVPGYKSEKRWGITPYLGIVAPLNRVNGWEMRFAGSLGVRSTFNFVDFFGVGLGVQADIIHFSKNRTEGRSEDIDFSRLTPLLLLEFKVPNLGLYFGPHAGISYHYFAFRESGGFLSHRDDSGTEILYMYGGFVGWNFKLGRRVSMGPRVDFNQYDDAEKTEHITSHSTLNTYFTTKFSF